MARITKQKPIKAEVVETVHGSSKMVTPALSFLGSFIFIVVFILGVNWYGKQIDKTIKTIFRAPLVIKSPFAKYVPVTIYYDPLNLIEAVKNKRKDIVFLDIRSKAEYTKEHVKNAISLPSYSIENENVVYTDIQGMLKKVTIDKSKFIVIYGPSSSFQFQQTVLSELKKAGYNAQQLAVGWNELRHFQNVWLPESLWGKVDISNSIEKGNE